MTKSTWARSGARPSTGRGVRPAGSWAASVERARASWDGLTLHRADAGGLQPAEYSDIAASAILSVALGLWSDTSASMGEDGSGDDA
jgi:hypothetical protein